MEAYITEEDSAPWGAKAAPDHCGSAQTQANGSQGAEVTCRPPDRSLCRRVSEYSLSRGNRTRKLTSLDMCLDMQWKVVTSRATSYGPLGQRNNPSGALMPGKGIG